MRPNNDVKPSNETLIRRILKTAEDIYRTIKLSVPPEWLTSDMTVAQLRFLLLLYSEGPSQMSSIATSVGITVSTATGIVDNLVKKGLVIRQAHPEDRRLVICALSTQGKETVNRMWTLGQSQIKGLLKGLSKEQLEKTSEVAGFLLANVRTKVTLKGKSQAK
jgi:DNA-binding MarR family transcriptional regulator